MKIAATTRNVSRRHGRQAPNIGLKTAARKRPSSRQRARTEATRGKLLAAAELVFTRVGFEAARLEDIAAEAGYTRGAFYANFDSKEAIFFDLKERWVAERIAEVNALLDRQETPRQRLDALRDLYAQFAHDRRLSLLSLEFKLFAIRHPEAHARLRTRSRALLSCGGEILQRIAKSVGVKLPVSSESAATALGAFSHALLLEHLVDPKSIPPSDIRALLKILFGAIFENSSR
jgi:AcrR family transcriptional regulator